METLVAKHLKQISGLRRWHEQDLKSLNEEIGDLRAENRLLKLEKKRHARTVEDREAQIYQLTKRGSPYSNIPCSLCGRVGEKYAENTNERVKDKQPSEEEIRLAPPKPPPNGKTWLEGLGCYTLPVKDAPRYHHNKCARDNARILKSERKVYDKEALEWRTSDEEESDRGGNGEDDGGSDDVEVDENGWPKRQWEDTVSDEGAGGW